MCKTGRDGGQAFGWGRNEGIIMSLGSELWRYGNRQKLRCELDDRTAI